MTMEAPNFFKGGFSGTGECYFEQQKLTDINHNNNNQFTIDDLFVDFPNDGDVVMNDALFDGLTGNSDDSFTVAAVHNCNSSVSGGEPQFSGDISSGSFSESQFSGGELFVPYDDLAELEWLTSFTEESFSSDDLHNLQLISAANKAPATDTSSSDNTPEYVDEPLVPNRIHSPIFHANVLVPGKARSTRSRAAPCDWTSRLLLLKPSPSNTDIKQHQTTPSKKVGRPESSVHRCLHCGSDKTPQWRTGPMGPKTLCNACGVRYKSGRLVPEYRPAASPTFVSAKHSNSHRKVIELRRQKELRESLNQTSIYGGCNGGNDNLIHRRQRGLNFMHMI